MHAGPGILASPTGTSRKCPVLHSSHPKLQAATPGPLSPRDPTLSAFRSENPPVLCALKTQSTGRTHHAASSPAPPLLRDRRWSAEGALSPSNPDEIPRWFPNPRETLLRATSPPTPRDLDNAECVPNDAPEKKINSWELPGVAFSLLLVSFPLELELQKGRLWVIRLSRVYMAGTSERIKERMSD